MRIAIIGAESTHARSFAAFLAPKEGEKLFPNIEIIGVYADASLQDSISGIEGIQRVSSCEYFTDNYLEFIEQVDAVMITSRLGKSHLLYARPFLEKGIPVWIDKPLCMNVADAVELVTLAQKYKAAICGGSSLVFSKEIKALAEIVRQHSFTHRGGHITAPIHMESEYGGFWFYAPHAIEMMTNIFGTNVRSVIARREKDSVRALYEYNDFAVSVYFGAGYTASVNLDNNHTKCFEVSLEGCSQAELLEFYNMVSTGKGVVNYKAYIAPVCIIEATVKAFEQDKRIEIIIPEV
ncbi:MAG: Gfo/Idh/MocA family oxidoreductase [Lachnospiraceae bacterium]|nr:Gfo/Idh/MocA family oxidoreductase [Lachnospiraceae bacterium]